MLLLSICTALFWKGFKSLQVFHEWKQTGPPALFGAVAFEVLPFGREEASRA